MYQRLRSVVRSCVDHKWIVAGLVVGVFALAVVGMGSVTKQFFSNSDRHEVMIEVNMPDGSAISATERQVAQIEAAVRKDPEAKLVTRRTGQQDSQDSAYSALSGPSGHDGSTCGDFKGVAGD